MNTIVAARDMLALTRAQIASALTTLTAGGAGDNTAVTGLSLDLETLGRPQNCIINWLFQTTLAASQTLTIGTLAIQDSADGTTWATYAPPAPVAAPAAPGVVATGAGTVRGVARTGIILTAARRFVRVNWTPDLSAANTDTASVFVMASFAGFDRLPTP